MGIDYVKLIGRAKYREQRVQRFQSGEVPLFLTSPSRLNVEPL